MIGGDGIDASIKELELGDVKLDCQEVDQRQVLIDADISRRSFIQGGN